MSRLLQGDHGFKYAYSTVRRDLPIQDLARVARCGTLRLVVDHYDIGQKDSDSELLFLEQLEGRAHLQHDDDRGFYFDDGDHDVTAEQLFQRLVEREQKVTVPALLRSFESPGVTRIDVHANVQYQFFPDSDMDPMMAYLNSRLPEGATLSLEEIRAFSSDLLSQFDPEQHEPNREDGTGFLMYFLETGEDDCLPYLAFRIVVHAVEHELEVLDIDDEVRWQRRLWPGEEQEAKDDEAAPESGEHEVEQKAPEKPAAKPKKTAAPKKAVAAKKAAAPKKAATPKKAAAPKKAAKPAATKTAKKPATKPKP